MKIALVCGDRNWTNKNLIKEKLQVLQNKGFDVIIEGEARGADLLARQVALELGIEVIGVPAVWNKYGKGAGPIRNQKMLDIGKPEIVLAFHNDISSSKGTAHMINISKKAGISVFLFGEGGKSERI